MIKRGAGVFKHVHRTQLYITPKYYNNLTQIIYVEFIFQLYRTEFSRVFHLQQF